MSMWQKSMQSTHTTNVINSRKYAIWMLYIHFDWTDPISLWGKPICQLLRFFILISLVQFVYSDHNENDIRFQTFCTVLCARKNEDTRCTYSVFAVTFHRVPVLLDIHRNALRKTFQFFSLFRGQLCPAPDDLVFSIEFCSSPILVYPSWLYSLLSNATVFFLSCVRIGSLFQKCFTICCCCCCRRDKKKWRHLLISPKYWTNCVVNLLEFHKIEYYLL